MLSYYIYSGHQTNTQSSSFFSVCVVFRFVDSVNYSDTSNLSILVFPLFYMAVDLEIIEFIWRLCVNLNRMFAEFGPTSNCVVYLYLNTVSEMKRG